MNANILAGIVIYGVVSLFVFIMYFAEIQEWDESPRELMRKVGKAILVSLGFPLMALYFIFKFFYCVAKDEWV